MSGVIFKGKIAQDLLPDLEFIPGVGLRTRPKHLRTHDEAVRLAANYFRIGMRAAVTQEGDSPIWRVTASIEGDPSNPDPTSEELQNTHELRANVLNPDWKTNLYTQNLFTASPAAASMTYIERRANGIKSDDVKYADVVDDLVVDTNSPILPADYDLAVSLLDELLAGADTFLDFQYVYTHAFTFGSGRDYPADFNGVRKIFTAQEVINAEGTPAGFEMPAGDWVKLPPEKTVMYGGRASLKYEYWWAGQWSPLRYADS